jgi:hypothetical protein
LPHVLIGLSVFHVGEILGYATGTRGNAAEGKLGLELDRYAHVAQGDKTTASAAR